MSKSFWQNCLGSYTATFFSDYNEQLHNIHKTNNHFRSIESPHSKKGKKYFQSQGNLKGRSHQGFKSLMWPTFEVSLWLKILFALFWVWAFYGPKVVVGLVDVMQLFIVIREKSRCVWSETILSKWLWHKLKGKSSKTGTANTQCQKSYTTSFT